MFYNILLPIATGGVYTYKADCEIKPGQRVSVPLWKRELVGICIEATSEPSFACKEIIRVIDNEPLFPNIWLSFINKIAEYYIAPLGNTLHGVMSQTILSSLPPKDFDIPKMQPPEDVTLSDEQQVVADSISLDKYSAHLIQGVTGSGKTEVYLDLIKRTIKKGRQALYLVPEISLTPQLVDRLTTRLGFEPAIFHSKLTPKKRNESFWRFVQGKSSLMIGARSALFVPSQSLGLIIVDEEHENTFKQEEMPMYHLRDMAVLYASLSNIPIIMGSATPQVESIANTSSGKYQIHYLRSRHGKSIMPEINLVDMKAENLVGDVLAESVYDKLYKTVENGEQAILFLNRKGYATSLYCKQCGKIYECANCSVPITMYKSLGKSICHYCGEEYRKFQCPECGCEEVFDAGAGTERVEEFLESMFPNNVVRIDTDKISTFKQLNKALDRFNNKEAQILVGTQLIAKGLHFPEVTFVGILGIDNVLSIPDFRASEKTYQLVMQVSGRAGRGSTEGKVYIQTHNTENPLFQYFITEPEEFYKYELTRRQEYGYPPYSKMARIIFTYSDKSAIKCVADTVIDAISNRSSDVAILGPAPAAIYKIKNQYRFSVLIKSKSNIVLSRILNDIRAIFEKQKNGTMGIKIDRDPYYFM